MELLEILCASLNIQKKYLCHVVWYCGLESLSDGRAKQLYS